MKKTMLLSAALLALAIAACNTDKPKEMPASGLPVAQSDEAPQSKDAMLRRGAYLVTLAGCNDCHTPKKMTATGPAPDMDRMLSGYNAAIPLGTYDTALTHAGQWLMFNGQNTAFAGPWGLSFAANLTPDATGLGNWSLAQFRNAMMHGKAKGLEAARPLLPPMPWQNYAQLTEPDIEAIYDYLKSIRPVSNRVPDAIVAQH